ncbi:MAG: glycosyl hydrolase family 28 protein [Tannerellaceae bacterium]|nr:glycosyl hydrolase family 28 protein [Tannerellaceae bacterium]
MNKLYFFLFLILSIALHSNAQYNILDFGAVRDTTVLSTDAIQEAIDMCGADGGGTVVIPAGNYLSGPLFMRSNTTLLFETGATVYASKNPDDYVGKGREHGASDAVQANSLIMALGCENIRISGSGTLHGQAVRAEYQRDTNYDPQEPITGRDIAIADQYGADYRTKYRRVAPSPGLINMTECKDVVVEDIRLIESAFWTFHLQWCERVTVRGVYIQSDESNGVNSDGLDIDGCRQVRVSDCLIDTGDDALCIKTTRSQDRTQPCEDLVITNCILRSSSAALKIGTESHADFRRITVSNCIINGANRGLNMIIRDGGHVSDVKFSNLIISTERKRTFWWGNGDPIWLIIANRTPESPTGSIRNVTFDNITATGQSGIRLEGMSRAIENIRFKNVDMYMIPENAVDKRSRHGFHFAGVKDLIVSECSMKWDDKSPETTWDKSFNFEDIENLIVEKIITQPAPGQKDAFSYKNITGVKQLTP